MDKLTTHTIYPLTPGLLISIALREDHAFGCDMNAGLKALGWPVEPEADTLARKQRKGIIRAYMTYYKARMGHYEEVATSLLEECNGTGFYSPNKEQWYRSIALPETVEFAEGWCQTHSQ